MLGSVLKGLTSYPGAWAAVNKQQPNHYTIIDGVKKTVFCFSVLYRYVSFDMERYIMIRMSAGRFS